MAVCSVLPNSHEFERVAGGERFVEDPVLVQAVEGLSLGSTFCMVIRCTARLALVGQRW
jgi:hypothetical protein